MVQSPMRLENKVQREQQIRLEKEWVYQLTIAAGQSTQTLSGLKQHSFYLFMILWAVLIWVVLLLVSLGVFIMWVHVVSASHVPML